MEIIYAHGGRPFKLDDDRIWDRTGRYVGRIADNSLIYSADGIA